MDQVYIANLGEGNRLWPIAQARNTIITTDNVAVHEFWRSRDRKGYIQASLDHTATARGLTPTLPTAGRWYNLLVELQETANDLWITRQGNSLWWTISLPGELSESLQPSTVPEKDGPEVWRVEKPCQPWSDRDGAGRPLRWDALHPKAKDFLSTEATFQRIANDRGYADYARALIAGTSLDQWHATPLFSKKAAEAKQPGARLFSPRELAAARMTQMMFDTVAKATGETRLARIKVKETSLSQQDCEALLLLKMGEQEDRCALTGLPLGYDRECDDRELLASLDRIDSSGHYTPDNVQLVCRFVNRWKSADDDALFRRLVNLLRGHFREERGPAAFLT